MNHNKEIDNHESSIQDTTNSPDNDLKANSNSLIEKKRNIEHVEHEGSKSKHHINTKEAKLPKKEKERWRVHRMNEDYINFVGDLMYPKIVFGPYGYNPEKKRYPVERFNTLGYLQCPLRRPTVIEKWSPLEIAIFEGAITLHGKHFHLVQNQIKTKTVKEVIEFYYEWKKTSHYKQWKDIYIPDEREYTED